MKTSSLALAAAVITTGVLAFSLPAEAQRRGPPTPQGPPPPAQQAAPIDLSGYWVSIIEEDWRWRMVTAPAGDFTSVPLNPAGAQIAKAFDRTKYGTSWTTQRIDCRAYYAGGVMRMPERVHITWSTPEQLKIETDWGQQTRTVYFKPGDVPGNLDQPSPQGRSIGSWERPFNLVGGMGFGADPDQHLPGGSLLVKTDHLTAGWLRRNGVPYSDKATMTEHFQTFVVPGTGKTWFDVTTIVDDPTYLMRSFLTSSEFRKEDDGSKWAPHPCVNLPAAG